MTHRPFLLVLLLVGSAVSASAGSPLSFAGSWGSPESATCDFSLDLTQHGEHLSGYHSAIAQHGNRVDAVLPDEGSPSITGTIVGRAAHIHFRSGYDESAYGEALLTLQPNGTLRWKVTKSVGAFYLPTTATLRK